MIRAVLSAMAIGAGRILSAVTVRHKTANAAAALIRTGVGAKLATKQAVLANMPATVYAAAFKDGMMPPATNVGGNVVRTLSEQDYHARLRDVLRLGILSDVMLHLGVRTRRALPSAGAWTEMRRERDRLVHGRRRSGSD